MGTVEEFKASVERGKKKFDKLYALSDAELTKMLADRYGSEERFKHLFDGKNANITRTIVNESPKSIRFEFYDSVEIMWTGIYFQPEHGSRSLMMDFTKTKEANALIDFLSQD